MNKFLADYDMNEIEYVATTDNMKIDKSRWNEYLDCPVYKTVNLHGGKLGIILGVL